MEFFKKIAPQIPRVFEKKDFTRYKRFVFNHLKVNKISSPDFMSFAGKDLPNKYVTGSGLPVFAWTVRSNSDMEKVLPHCDNFIFENFIPVNDENNRIYSKNPTGTFVNPIGFCVVIPYYLRHMYSSKITSFSLYHAAKKRQSFEPPPKPKFILFSYGFRVRKISTIGDNATEKPRRILRNVEVLYIRINVFATISRGGRYRTGRG